MLKSLIFVSIFSFLSLKTYANLSDQYSMIPMRIESKMKIGETREFLIKIKNEMKKKKMEDYKIELNEFILSSEGKIKTGTKEKNIRSILPYSRLSNDKINLEPGKEALIKLIVSIPKDYKKGSGYLIYTLKKDDSPEAKGKGFVFMKNVSGFIAINIEDNMTKDIKLNKISYNNKKLDVEIENSGESYLKTSGKAVIIKNDKKIGIFDFQDNLNRQEFLNIPGTKRIISTMIPIKDLKGVKVNIIISDINSDYLKSEIFDLKK